MQLVAAEYVLDFGYVIKGTQKAGSAVRALSRLFLLSRSVGSSVAPGNVQ